MNTCTYVKRLGKIYEYLYLCKSLGKIYEYVYLCKSLGEMLYEYLDLRMYTCRYLYIFIEYSKDIVTEGHTHTHTPGVEIGLKFAGQHVQTNLSFGQTLLKFDWTHRSHHCWLLE